jgi:2,3-bisphosphoglycerate-independent phosphoglycerate mutase
VLVTDTQRTGVEPLPARAADDASRGTARAAQAFVDHARAALRGRARGNAVLLRGFSGRPPLPTLRDVALLTGCAVAPYPAYRGVARLLGMEVQEEAGPGSDVAREVSVLEKAWRRDFDFFFLHVKGTDSAGEDGDEERKARVIEEFDAQLPRILALGPDVVVLSGDHSTPGPMAGHSWHPVPFLLFGPWCEPDGSKRFDEEACHRGRFGDHLPATALLRLALANAGKLAKYGA